MTNFIDWTRNLQRPTSDGNALLEKYSLGRQNIDDIYKQLAFLVKSAKSHLDTVKNCVLCFREKKEQTNTFFGNWGYSYSKLQELRHEILTGAIIITLLNQGFYLYPPPDSKMSSKTQFNNFFDTDLYGGDTALDIYAYRDGIHYLFEIKTGVNKELRDLFHKMKHLLTQQEIGDMTYCVIDRANNSREFVAQHHFIKFNVDPTSISNVSHREFTFSLVEYDMVFNHKCLEDIYKELHPLFLYDIDIYLLRTNNMTETQRTFFDHAHRQDQNSLTDLLVLPQTLTQILKDCCKEGPYIDFYANAPLKSLLTLLLSVTLEYAGPGNYERKQNDLRSYITHFIDCLATVGRYKQFQEVCRQNSMNLTAFYNQFNTRDASTLERRLSYYKEILSNLLLIDNNIDLAVSQHKGSGTLKNTTPDDIISAHSNLESQVKPEKFDIKHTHSSTVSRHFLLTPEYIERNCELTFFNLKPQENIISHIEDKLNIQIPRRTIKTEKVFTLTAIEHLTSSLKQIEKATMWISNPYLSLKNVHIYNRESLHEGVDLSETKNHNFIVYDPNTVTFVRCFSALMNSIFGSDDFLNNYTTVSYINNILYREGLPNAQDDNSKKIKKERSTLYSGLGLNVFTGYNNTFKILRKDQAFEFKNLYSAIGKGDKKKHQIHMKQSYLNFNDMLSTGRDEVEARTKAFDTKRDVIDPNCNQCLDFVSKMEKMVIDFETSNKDSAICKDLELMLKTYFTMDLPPVELSFIKSSLECIKNRSLHLSTYSTQILFKQLLIMMNVSRIKDTVTVLTTPEKGRYFIVLPKYDGGSKHIQYCDLFIGGAENVGGLTMLNSDSCAFQSYIDGRYIAISKPFKLDTIRVEALSRLYHRFLSCLSSYSISNTKIVNSSEGIFNCLHIASNITMAKLSIFDLSRHQANLVLGTQADYYKFIEDKYDYPCKSVVDLHFYITIKKWLLDICRAKEKLKTDVDPNNEFSMNSIQENPNLFYSYVTKESCLSFSDLLTCIFGGIYYSLKALHNPATSLLMLQEVPATWEEKLTKVIGKTQWCNEGIFTASSAFSHDMEQLIRSINRRYVVFKNNQMSSSCAEEACLDQPVDSVPTLVSTKSSVKVETTNKDEGFAKALKKAFNDVIRSKNLPLHREFYYMFKDKFNERQSQLFESSTINLYHEETMRYNSNIVSIFQTIPEQKKIPEVKSVTLLKLLSKLEDMIQCTTLPVQSALYEFLQENRLMVESWGTIKDLLSSIYDWHLSGKKLPKHIIRMFPKGQRTKVDREIYILGLVEKLEVFFIERVYQCINKQDPQEAITIAGDEKKAKLVQLEGEMDKIYKDMKLQGYTPEVLYLSMDQSKWSASDSFYKYIIMTMCLHFLTLKDRFAMVRVLVGYMQKKIYVDDDVFNRLAKEYSYNTKHTSDIIKVTNGLKQNWFRCRYNWLQGVFNNMSSHCHSLAIDEINHYWDKKLQSRQFSDWSDPNQFQLQAMVHSDDGAIGVVYHLNDKTKEFFERNGGFQHHFFLSVEAILKRFGITLNVTKTFASKSVLDFISDYVIEKEPVGNFVRIAATLPSPLDHKSPYLDILQMSGPLQNLIKSNASPQQIFIHSGIASWFVADTYNLSTTKNISKLNELRKALDIEVLPLSLFGPISCSAEIIGMVGLKANDPLVLIKQLALDLSSTRPSDQIKEVVYEHYNKRHNKIPYRAALEFILSRNNFQKMSDLSWISETTITLSQLISSMHLENETETVFDLMSTNLHLLKIPIRKREAINLSRAPHVKNALDTFFDEESYKQQLAEHLLGHYKNIESPSQIFNFITNMHIKALSSKTFSNLSRMTTTETRKNIMTDIRKKFFHIGDILHQIDTSTATMSFIKPNQPQFKEQLDLFFNNIAKTALSNRRKVIKDEDLLFDIDSSRPVDLSNQFGNNRNIINPMLKKYMDEHIQLKGKDYKFNFSDGLDEVTELCRYIKEHSRHIDNISIRQAIQHNIATNIDIINVIGYSLLSHEGLPVPYRKVHITRTRLGNNDIRFVGKLEQTLLQLIRNETSIITLNKDSEHSESVEITIDFKILLDKLGLTDIFAHVQELFNVMRMDENYVNILHFHYYFDLLVKALKTVLQPKVNKRHYFYCKAVDYRVAPVVMAIKGNMHQIFHSYDSSSYIPNAHSYYDFILKRSVATDMYQCKIDSLTKFCHILLCLESSIKALYKSKFDSGLTTDGLNELRNMADHLAKNSYIMDKNIYQVIQSLDLNSIYRKNRQQLFVSTILYNFGLLILKDPEVQSLTQNRFHIQWPNSEQDRHAVTILNPKFVVTYEFGEDNKLNREKTVLIHTSQTSPKKAVEDARFALAQVFRAKIKAARTSTLQNNTPKVPIRYRDYVCTNTRTGPHVGWIKDNDIKNPRKLQFIEGQDFHEGNIMEVDPEDFYTYTPLVESPIPLKESLYYHNTARCIFALNNVSGDFELISIEEMPFERTTEMSLLQFSNCMNCEVQGFKFVRFFNDFNSRNIVHEFKNLSWLNLSSYFSSFAIPSAITQIFSRHNTNPSTVYHMSYENIIQVVQRPYSFIIESFEFNSEYTLTDFLKIAKYIITNQEIDLYFHIGNEDIRYKVEQTLFSLSKFPVYAQNATERQKFITAQCMWKLI